MLEYGVYAGCGVALLLAAVVVGISNDFFSGTEDGLLSVGALVVGVTGFADTRAWSLLLVAGGAIGWMYIREKAITMTSGDGESLDPDEFLVEDAIRTFDDVGGMDDLKGTLTERVIKPLRNPGRYEEYDLGATNGVLLYGPPGCGKTYVAGALAGELDFSYIEIKPSDFASRWVGQAPENVAEVFDIARDNQPCLLFIDEIDAVASDREAEMTNSEQQMVNQLLTELQAVDDEDVVVVGATNYLDDIDEAILRSGRFDERVEVPPPGARARKEILWVHLQDRPHRPSLDLDEAVAESAGYASSDVELVAELAARHAMADGDVIDERHLADALAETTTSIPGWLHRYGNLGERATAAPTVAQPEGTNLPAAEVVESSVDEDLADVPGMRDQKDALRERLLLPMREADRYARMGVDDVDGVLLHGPPGCGKARLARATAGTLDRPFVPIRAERLSDWDREPVEVLDDLFAVARANEPCVLFVDDLDALAPAGGQSQQGELFAQRLAGDLESLLDYDVVVIGATGEVDAVHESVRRAGCFDEFVEVPVPDAETCAAVLRAELDESLVGDGFDWDAAGRALEGFAIDDVTAIADSVGRTALREQTEVTLAAVRDAADEYESTVADWSGPSDDGDGLRYIG